MNNREGMGLLLEALEGEETRDSSAKKIFSRKEVLSVIMKNTISEYENCSLEEIMGCIEGDTMRVGTAAVSPDMANTIRGETQESKPKGEALAIYDIIFRSLVPGMQEGIAVNLHIDLELQGNGSPGYPIENRAVYYACRRISSQIQKASKEDPAYGKLEKVYSIWILFDRVKKRDRDSMSWHKLQTYRTEGALREKNVDFLEIVIVRLGGYKRNNELIDFLYSIVSGDREKAYSYMPKMDLEERAEVDEMFSLTEYVEKKAREEERKNTRREKRRADKAERKADQAEKKADQAEKKADQAEKKVDQAKRKADQAEKKAIAAEKELNSAREKIRLLEEQLENLRKS